MSPRVILLITVVLALVAAFFVYPPLSRRMGLDFLKKVPYKLGLDLKGGTHLVYQADVSQVTDSDQDEALEGLKSVIESRVNQFGVAEPVITVNKGTHRLIAELAGVLDVEEAIRIIGETPFLEFKELQASLSSGTSTLEVEEEFVPTELTGRYITGATRTLDPTTNAPLVVLEFSEEGRRVFADVTRRNVGKPLAIFIDGESIVDTTDDGLIDEQDLYAPIVQGPIENGSAQITGFASHEEAQELVENLKAGALPLPIELVSQQTVGPALGAESLSQSLFAGVVGFTLVVLYMILYYRAAGVIAAITLVLYLLFALSLFKLIGVTLTLAGVVGFILTIGMAVDANILIFERLREEIRAKRELRVAVEVAFQRAWTAIKDANVSTIMTAVVLYALTTSLIRGFAVTLVLGLFVSLLSTLLITRALLRVVAGTSLARARRLWRT